MKCVDSQVIVEKTFENDILIVVKRPFKTASKLVKLIVIYFLFQAYAYSSHKDLISA